MTRESPISNWRSIGSAQLRSASFVPRRNNQAKGIQSSSRCLEDQPDHGEWGPGVSSPRAKKSWRSQSWRLTITNQDFSNRWMILQVVSLKMSSFLFWGWWIFWCFAWWFHPLDRDFLCWEFTSWCFIVRSRVHYSSRKVEHIFLKTHRLRSFPQEISIWWTSSFKCLLKPPCQVLCW